MFLEQDCSRKMIKHGNLIDFTLVFMVLLVRSLFINDRYANFSVTNKRENKTWSLNLNKVLNVNRIIARLMGPVLHSKGIRVRRTNFPESK